MESISCGVPQVSCLGPLLFLLCINDIPYSSTNVKLNVYADDTSHAHSGIEVDNVTQVMNSELSLAVADSTITGEKILNSTQLICVQGNQSRP